MIGEHRIRVRVIDGRKLKYGKVKALLSPAAPDLHVHDTGDGLEFVVCTTKPERLDAVRSKLGAAGLKEIPGSTDVAAAPAPLKTSSRPWVAPAQHGGAEPAILSERLRKKPYGFVALPKAFSVQAPVWHDGTCSKDRLSGEIRFELENLTPLLVGCQRRNIGEDEALALAVRRMFPNRELPASKSVLYPLRVPWGNDHPVLIPADSLKGLLRQELGALLGAPMERVAERSYSYRPNSLYPKPGSHLIPRLARVPREGGVEMRDLLAGQQVRVPTALELLPENLRFDRNGNAPPPRYQFDPPGERGATYQGGIGAGDRLNSRKRLHERILVEPNSATLVKVPREVQEGYLNTVQHLTDTRYGHFSERHPDVPTVLTGDTARSRILQAAANEVFSPGDLIWVEWDNKRKRIVSVGWHYYYRWAYQDTVRRKGWQNDRDGLAPLPEELNAEDGAPEGLSAVRRLFGYTGDNQGSKGIGREDYTQLMGRIAVNSALEIVKPNGRDRFLPAVFLKELGMPRPSAVEFYLEQPNHPNPRPTDRATLLTYGDAAGYDPPGELCGRKFYLDREDAYTDKPWEDNSVENCRNERSTLALDASRPGCRFRFTLRFRDLDPQELAAVLLALCPHQLQKLVGGRHPHGYCSKLGYARPLGWGTVRIEAKELHFLKQDAVGTRLDKEADVAGWFEEHFSYPAMLEPWLDVHRAKNPDAGDYPRKNGEIYTYHASLRAEHSRERRHEGAS